MAVHALQIPEDFIETVQYSGGKIALLAGYEPQNFGDEESTDSCQVKNSWHVEKELTHFGLEQTTIDMQELMYLFHRKCEHPYNEDNLRRWNVNALFHPHVGCIVDRIKVAQYDIAEQD